MRSWSMSNWIVPPLSNWYVCERPGKGLLVLLSPQDGHQGNEQRYKKETLHFLCCRQRFSSRSTCMLFMKYVRNFPTDQGKGDSNKDLLRIYMRSRPKENQK